MGCSDNCADMELEPNAAVILALWAALTVPAETVKDAVVAPEATVTDVGAVRNVLDEATVTVVPVAPAA